LTGGDAFSVMGPMLQMMLCQTIKKGETKMSHRTLLVCTKLGLLCLGLVALLVLSCDIPSQLVT